MLLSNKPECVFLKVYRNYEVQVIVFCLFSRSDGSTQALGTCLRDFRNKPYPVRAKITYYKRTLTVGENMNLLALSVYIFTM